MVKHNEMAMQTLSDLPTNMPVARVEIDYDYMSRRVGKTVYEWGSNSWQEVSSATFLYDAWNLISEQTHKQTSAETNFFTFGLDLSGTLQGAGGIGGLVSAVLGTNAVCYMYDGNGNVSEVLDIGAGTPSSRILAHYEYSPFGETIVATGGLAKDNSFRFSSKYTDDETSLVYYGYRYYSPGLGRWVNRDPIGENGGLNIYAFVLNNPVKDVDALGLAHFCCPDELAAVQAQYQQCVQGVIQDWRTCTANARTVRDTALAANQQEYDQMCQTIRNAGQQCRTGCQNQFPDQDFARSSCIFLCDTVEGTGLNVAYGAYVAQRGTIWVTYAGLIAYCDVQKANRWEDCKNAGRAVCTNFSP